MGPSPAPAARAKREDDAIYERLPTSGSKGAFTDEGD